MPQFYRVLKADPLDGEFTPNKPNAKPLKSFWCQVEGVEAPVMMSKQVPNSPSLTEGHYGVLEERTSAKGNTYWKFTGMQIPQGTSKPHYDGSVATENTAPASAPAPHPSNQADIPLWFAPFGIMLKEVYDYVQERKGTPLTQHDVFKEAAKDEPKPESIGGGSITKDELEEIFGGPMADPVDLTDRED